MESSNLKILAIDDNPDNLTALKAVVQDLLPGCTVWTALNGIRGIEMAAAKDPDVILLDLVMPDLDGFAVCQRLKADERLRSIPVVFLTALKTDRESRVRALQAGGEGFLTKPPDEMELIAAIQAMAKVKAANRVQRLEREQLAAMVAARTADLEHSRQATLSILEDLINENNIRKQKEQELRSITDSAQDAILMMDPQGAISFWNPAAEAILGYRADEVLGTDLHRLLTAESDREAHHAAFPEFLRTGRGNAVGRTLEMAARRKDGRQIEVALSLSSLCRNGQWHAVGILRDITEAKQVQETLRETRDYLEKLFAHTSAPIIVWDPSFRITRLNPAFEKLIGIPAAEALGQPLDILFPADSRDCFMDLIRLTSGESWSMQEIPVFDRKTGTIRIVLWNRASIFGPDGKTLDATIAQGIDITERRRAEDALRKTVRERETLLKEVHHRVKNNLQIITSLMSLQARRDQTPAIVAAFRTMQDRVRSMAMLHEALYRSADLARIDFKPYLERMCGQLSHSFDADATRVKIETRVNRVMLPLEQAVPCGLLINELVTNVLKHAFPDGRQGKATVALEFETDRTLVLTVSDDGVGLPETANTKQAKTLGLELVRGLTQQLEGTLSVERGPQGTTFRVAFPAPLECA